MSQGVNINFNHNIISLDVIKKAYYLNKLGVKGSVQVENIASIIQSIYFYHDLIVKNNIQGILERNLCRNIIIHSFSVIEAIVISVGYKIQRACLKSSVKHSFCSNSMFSHPNPKTNEIHAFKNADAYLQKIGFLDFKTVESRRFYVDFRNTRNDVHIIKSDITVDKNPRYTRKYCQQAVTFLQTFFEVFKNNLEYLEKRSGLVLDE